jgi:hypothetical protein
LVAVLEEAKLQEVTTQLAVSVIGYESDDEDWEDDGDNAEELWEALELIEPANSAGEKGMGHIDFELGCERYGNHSPTKRSQPLP